MNAIGWALMAACIWGVVPILEKVGLTKIDPFVGLWFRCVGVFLGLLCASLLVKPAALKAVEPRTMFVLISAGFLASFVAQICFYHSLKAGDVSRVVPVAGSFPLIAFVLGILVLGESLTLMKGIGVVLIVGGIWLLKL